MLFEIFTDGPDIWIEGPEKVVCGSAAHFKATVKEKRVSSLSVTWQKIINDESKQIDTSNIKFSQNLCIKSVCKKDEGKYQAILSFEENGVRKTVHSNSVSLQVEGGIMLIIRYFIKLRVIIEKFDVCFIKIKTPMKILF